MPHTTTPPPSNVTYHDVVWLAGPRFIGILFNWGLLGLLTSQLYVYYISFPNDRRFIKGLVYGVYLLEWAQTISATHDAFAWFVYGFGDIPGLFQLHTEWLNVPVLSSLAAFVVQTFFGWRLWTLSRSLPLPVVISILSLIQLGAAGATAFFIIIDPSEVSRAPGIVEAVGVRLRSGLAADMLIAAGMTYFLLRRKEDAMGQLNNVITRIVRLTIETGTITALFALLDLLFFLTQHNGLHQVTGVTLGKVYLNTLLVLFNNRTVMAQFEISQTTQTNVPMSRFQATVPITSSFTDELEIDLESMRPTLAMARWHSFREARQNVIDIKRTSSID